MTKKEKPIDRQYLCVQKKPAINFTNERKKLLSEVIAADIPRGLTADDVAIDGIDNGGGYY